MMDRHRCAGFPYLYTPGWFFLHEKSILLYTSPPLEPETQPKTPVVKRDVGVRILPSGAPHHMHGATHACAYQSLISYIRF